LFDHSEAQKYGASNLQRWFDASSYFFVGYDYGNGNWGYDQGRLTDGCSSPCFTYFFA
jgi:uncharacterized protein YutD